MYRKEMRGCEEKRRACGCGCVEKRCMCGCIYQVQERVCLVVVDSMHSETKLRASGALILLQGCALKRVYHGCHK